MPEESVIVESDDQYVDENAEDTPLQDAAPAPADDAADDDTPEEKPEGRFQKRIGQLVGERNALRDDRDYWRDQALTKPPEPEKPEKESEPPKRPTLSDFDSDLEKYADALGEYTDQAIDYNRKLAVKEVQEEASTASERATAAEHDESLRVEFAERSQEFAKDHSDYYDIISNPRIKISGDMAQIMMEMDDGPAVGYYLGMHPEKAVRIANQTGHSVALSLGRIARELSASTPTNESTNAPEPGSRIGGKGGKITKDPSKLSMKEYAKWYYGRNKG